MVVSSWATTEPMILKLDSKLPSGAGKGYSLWDKTIRCKIIFLLCYPSISSPPFKDKLHQWPTRSHLPCPSTTALTIQAIPNIVSSHPLSQLQPHRKLTGFLSALDSQEFALAGPSAENTLQILQDPSSPSGVCSSMAFLERPSLITHVKAALFHLQAPPPHPQPLYCFILLHNTHNHGAHYGFYL